MNTSTIVPDNILNSNDTHDPHDPNDPHDPTESKDLKDLNDLLNSEHSEESNDTMQNNISLLITKPPNVISNESDNISSDSILDILEHSNHESINLVKKKKNGLYSLNTYDEIFFKKYKDRLIRKKAIYVLSSELFQKKALLLTIPSILITCLMSIISFLSASTFFTENTRIILGLVVGGLGSIGTLCQSFQSALNYNTKAEAFRTAAEKYDTLITKIKFELYNHDEKDFIDTLEKDVLKISTNCKYFPPQSMKNLIQINSKIKHMIEDNDHNYKEDTTNINITIDK